MYTEPYKKIIGKSGILSYGNGSYYINASQIHTLNQEITIGLNYILLACYDNLVNKLYLVKLLKLKPIGSFIFCTFLDTNTQEILQISIKLTSGNVGIKYYLFDLDVLVLRMNDQIFKLRNEKV